MEPRSKAKRPAKTPLLAEMDRAIAGIARVDRQAAYAALEHAFGQLKAAQDRLSQAEVSEFVELVHLVLLQFPRGATIRVSGPKQHKEIDVCLRYNDVYEAALHRALEFLSRNLFDHIEEYTPNQYLRAALRVLGREYFRLLTDASHTESIREESPATAEEESDGPALAGEPESGRCRLRADVELTVAGPQDQDGPAGPREDAVEQQMFLNWYEGNLARLELAHLYGLTIDCVNQALLRVARAYEDGRHYGMVRWLVEMGEDGDIIWLLSKGMTAADVGQKVERNRWVVYKRRDAILRRLAALGLTGEHGRALRARLFGPQADVEFNAPSRANRPRLTTLARSL